MRLFFVVLACLVPRLAAAQTAPDPLRECALAVRVAFPESTREGAPPKPRDEAVKRVREFQASMRAIEFDECLLLARIGFEHGFEPVTYALAPGQWVELSVAGATIANQGRATHFKWGFLRPGIRFLPPKHTEIVSGRPEGRRHFVELFEWAPEGPRRPDSWQLTWHLYEVDGSELIPIPMEPLLTVRSPQPPAAAALDVHAMVAVQVNDAGRVEARTGTGVEARRQFIPSPAERRAHDEETDRRKAAYEKVNWTRVGDVRRTPTLTYRDADGCGNAFVYGWSDDFMESISLRADVELLRLTATPQTFDVARHPSTLALAVHVYGRPGNLPFCTDVARETGPSEVWRAIAGQVTIEMLPTIAISGDPRQRVTIRLTGAVFVNAQGMRVAQTQPIVLTAIVGWVNG